MAYRERQTKYGNKTTAQIAAGLPGQQTGDTVFNTDYGIVEFYTGSVWTNNNSITLPAGATITEGQLCQINESVVNENAQAVLLNGFTSSNALQGIGVCQYGGTTGQTISLIVCGIAKCRVGSAGVVIGEYARMSASTGQSGLINSNPGVGTGTIGRVLQTQTSGNLAYVMLTFIERG
jgi:hypothetical protein